MKRAPAQKRVATLPEAIELQASSRIMLHAKLAIAGSPAVKETALAFLEARGIKADDWVVEITGLRMRKMTAEEKAALAAQGQAAQQPPG